MTSFAFARFFAAATIPAIAGLIWAAWSGQTWDVTGAWIVVAALAALISRAGARQVRATRRRSRDARRAENAVYGHSRNVVVRPNWVLVNADGELRIVDVRVKQ